MWKRQCFSGLLLALLTTAVAAAPRAEILEYGYYEFTSEVKRLIHPSATSGFVTKGEAVLVEQTQRIPIVPARLFGFRFRITGMSPTVGQIPLELVVTHPLMEKPDGTTSTGYRYTLDLKLTNGMVEDKTGYRMNESYEMVEGDWVFEYRFMNKPLITQRFTTYRP